MVSSLKPSPVPIQLLEFKRGEENMDGLLTVKDISGRISYSEWTIRDWLAKGKLRGYKIGGGKYGHWRIKEADLEEFIDGRRSPSE